MTEWAKIQNERQTAGLCRHCGKPQVAGHTLCETHRREAAERRRVKYNARKAAGACVECGEPPHPGIKRCLKCRDAYRAYQRPYNRERRRKLREKQDAVRP